MQGAFDLSAEFFRVLNAHIDGCDDFHFAATFGAGLDVDVKYSGKKPGPGNIFLFEFKLLWLFRLIVLHQLELRWFGYNLFSVLVVRPKHAVIAG